MLPLAPLLGRVVVMERSRACQYELRFCASMGELHSACRFIEFTVCSLGCPFWSTGFLLLIHGLQAPSVPVPLASTESRARHLKRVSMLDSR